MGYLDQHPRPVFIFTNPQSGLVATGMSAGGPAQTGGSWHSEVAEASVL